MLHLPLLDDVVIGKYGLAALYARQHSWHVFGLGSLQPPHVHLHLAEFAQQRLVGKEGDVLDKVVGFVLCAALTHLVCDVDESGATTSPPPLKKTHTLSND